VSILCIFLDFILYTNFVNEFIISFEITYKIMCLYIEIFSFLLYGPFMAINIAVDTITLYVVLTVNLFVLFTV